MAGVDNQDSSYDFGVVVDDEDVVSVVAKEDIILKAPDLYQASRGILTIIEVTGLVSGRALWFC
jgi:hypothetical protein